MMLRAVRYASH